jgi:hypothetical protein
MWYPERLFPPNLHCLEFCEQFLQTFAFTNITRQLLKKDTYVGPSSVETKVTKGLILDRDASVPDFEVVPNPEPTPESSGEPCDLGKCSFELCHTQDS